MGETPMVLLVSLGGSVTFVNTRSVLVNSLSFAAGQDDFGIGNENQALCPGCGRTLPTATMHIDHIRSKAQHQLQIAAAGTLVTLLDNTAPHAVSTRFAATCNGGVVTIVGLSAPPAGAGPVHGAQARRSARLEAAGPYGRALQVRFTVSTDVAWENDLENLQWLCGGCNTAKGPRDFAATFPGRNPVPFR
jgi:5-methylcytosine-specific restriction endonuclease McrA